MRSLTVLVSCASYWQNFEYCPIVNNQKLTFTNLLLLFYNIITGSMLIDKKKMRSLAVLVSRASFLAIADPKMRRILGACTSEESPVPYCNRILLILGCGENKKKCGERSGEQHKIPKYQNTWYKYGK